MKTKLLILLVIGFLSLSVDAQVENNYKSYKFGVGAMIFIPIGQFSQVDSGAFGFDLQGEYWTNPMLCFTLSTGYQEWVKEYSSLNNWSSIPVLGGIKYYFSKTMFVSGKAGLSFYTQNGKGSAFTFAPGLGFKITKRIDLLLLYQSAIKNGDKVEILGARAGFTF